MGTRGEKSSPSGVNSDTGQRKRAKYTEKRQSDSGKATTRQRPTTRRGDNDDLCREPRDLGITSLPVEILLEILSYLDCRDLYALRAVSKFFERLVREPRVWTAFEVNGAEPRTSEVIEELKRMPHLRKISIEARNDCDDILRQLSCSNKRLQRLSISDCTGSSANLYLRPGYLVRILERCPRLHTITIKGSRFRGSKFYRLLGSVGHRLRFVSTSTTRSQFRAFARHVSNLDERATDVLCSMCRGAGQWGPLCYYMLSCCERPDRSMIALVSYFYHDFLYVNVRPACDDANGSSRGADGAPRVGATSLSPMPPPPPPPSPPMCS